MYEDSRPARVTLTGTSAQIIACLVAAAVTFTLAVLSIFWGRDDGSIAALWLPNAVLASMLLRVNIPAERGLLAICGAAIVGANMVFGDSIVRGLIFAAANLLEIGLALALIRRFCGPHPDMRNIADLRQVVFFAGILSPVISGAALWGLWAFHAPASITIWSGWIMTKGLAMVIIAPIALILFDSIRGEAQVSRRSGYDWAAYLVGGTVVTVGVFIQSDYPLLFFIAPVIVAFAFRLGSLGTAIGTLMVAAVATAFTAMDSGPITLIDANMVAGATVLQAFIASAFVVGLPVAAVLHGRDQSAAALAERESDLALLADNITDAILRYDTQGRCTYASRSVESVLGAGPEAFVGRKASDRSHPDAADTIEVAQRRLLSGESKAERFTYRRVLDGPGGEPVWIEAYAAVAVDPVTGERDGIVVSARDVTERIALELLLKRARKHAENAAAAKSQFLANMSHEIRTPMNGVLGFADLLLAGDLDDEQRRHAELITQSGRSMMMLLNDILDISKIEAGQMEIQRTPTNLSDLIRECADLHRAQAQQKNIAITAQCDNDVPPLICTDQLRARQILLNLIGNAVKFTQHGAVIVSVSMRGELIEVAVRDTGIGIAPGRLDSVFRSFEQEDYTVTRKYGGTGLGLTISQQLAAMLGGSLRVTSIPGEGSTFTLTLPAILADEADHQAASVRSSSISPAALQDARILLAEDHDVNRLLVTAMLQKIGQCVTVAHDGNEAVAAIRDAAEAGRPFDLVLMDVQMPNCDGYAATRKIRAAGITGTMLPILALTANAYSEDIAAARDAGMQAHLAKPLRLETLGQALRQWLPGGGDIMARRGAETARLEPGPKTAGDHAPALQQKWEERREEALIAVRAALDSGTFTGDGHDDDLARTVHKLAGTAAMFGEEELGRKAAEFERALRSDTDPAQRERLAQDLLQAA